LFITPRLVTQFLATNMQSVGAGELTLVVRLVFLTSQRSGGEQLLLLALQGNTATIHL